jgi:hypothetical protein
VGGAVWLSHGEQGKRGLNSLRDGFDFGLSAGQGHALELQNVDVAYEQEPGWVLGILSIASEYSRNQMLLGSTFVVMVVLQENSKLIGVPFDAHPLALGPPNLTPIPRLRSQSP